jgi:hypothetical protein
LAPAGLALRIIHLLGKQMNYATAGGLPNQSNCKLLPGATDEPLFRTKGWRIYSQFLNCITRISYLSLSLVNDDLSRSVT